MERVLADAFYNRNCYGSLYRVEQKDKMKREPVIDLDYSVDRTYFTNRHQAQFIIQNLLSRFHFRLRDAHSTTSDMFEMEESEEFTSDRNEHYTTDQSSIERYERHNALFDDEHQLIDHDMDPLLSYSEHLMKHDAGTGLFRMVSAKDHSIDLIRICPTYKCKLSKVRNLIRYYNHLVFDFDTHHLVVEHLSDGNFDPVLRDCLATLLDSSSVVNAENLRFELPSHCKRRTEQRRESVQNRKYSMYRKKISDNSQEDDTERESLVNPIKYYRVNIEQLVKETKGFNHAAYQTSYPAANIDQFSFLDYTHLSHVSLAVTESSEKVFLLATYGGIVAL